MCRLGRAGTWTMVKATMEKHRSESETHVEPKDRPVVPYDQLPEEARDAMAVALLILIQRGREVLAGQVREQIGNAQDTQEVKSKR
jgi:hypothetical protein